VLCYAGRRFQLLVHWKAALGMAPLDIRYNAPVVDGGRHVTFTRSIVVQLPERLPKGATGKRDATRFPVEEAVASGLKERIALMSASPKPNPSGWIIYIAGGQA
jgi:hypothetical protein